MRLGIDVLAGQGFGPLHGKKVGLIVNPTSVDGAFRHLVDLVAAEPRVTLSALFGPEHGVRGEAQYMAPVGDVPRDPRLGVPVYSLYGHTLASLTPTPAQLEGLDALVFDIQDVGARYYTYLATMGLCLEAAARAGLDFWVLDRPNPLGLRQVEGNLVREGYRSFVGLYALPVRHGMTAGEVARWLDATHGWRARLHVVPVEGLSRGHRWADTGRAFIPPSPNMPTVDTALVYPGMCLGEGTNVSEGRGTTRPFEQFGAPWLDGAQVARALTALRLPGVHFRACSFTPTFDKHRGESCQGAFLHVTDAEAFQPFRTGVAVMKVCHDLGGGHFAWRADAYEFVEDVPAFDLLCGTDAIRLGIDAGRPLGELLEGFEAELPSFLAGREGALLYG